MGLPSTLRIHNFLPTCTSRREAITSTIPLHDPTSLNQDEVPTMLPAATVYRELEPEPRPRSAPATGLPTQLRVLRRFGQEGIRDRVRGGCGVES
jgi:hypothetical protein